MYNQKKHSNLLDVLCLYNDSNCQLIETTEYSDLFLCYQIFIVKTMKI